MEHARAGLILWLIAAVVVFLFPPVNLFLVLIVIGIISLGLSLIIRLFLPHKYALILFLAPFILLSLRALGLFDLVNVLLAISLLVAVFILIK